MKNQEEDLIGPIIAVALESKYGKDNVDSLMEIVNSHKCTEMATQVLLGIAKEPELPLFVRVTPGCSLPGRIGQVCKRIGYKQLDEYPIKVEYVYENAINYYFPSSVNKEDITAENSKELGKYYKSDLPEEEQDSCYQHKIVKNYSIRKDEVRLTTWEKADTLSDKAGKAAYEKEVALTEYEEADPLPY